MMKAISFFAILMFFAVSSFAEVPAFVQAAVDNPARPEKDVARDINRKPAEVLAFFGIQPGMKILDVFAGDGYYAEIASYLVGSKGEVTLYNNGSWAQYVQKKVAKRLSENRLPNANYIVKETDNLAFQSGYYDGALFILGFHDLYYEDARFNWNKIDVPAFLKAIYGALKPGGVLGIVDHIAVADAPVTSAQNLHRIDVAVIERDLKAAGFMLEGASDILRNPDDDHLKHMMDTSIRGHTDRVVMRFRKP